MENRTNKCLLRLCARGIEWGKLECVSAGFCLLYLIWCQESGAQARTDWFKHAKGQTARHPKAVVFQGWKSQMCLHPTGTNKTDKSF